MTARRNEVAVIAGAFARRPAEVLAIPLTPALACRRAEFELRTGIKIEQVILDFLKDELFNTAVPCPQRPAKASTGADIPSGRADIPSIGGQS